MEDAIVDEMGAKKLETNGAELQKLSRLRKLSKKLILPAEDQTKTN